MQQKQENQFTPEQISAPNTLFPQRKFTLFKLAGQGAQGYVYLAKSENWKYDNNKNLALKFSDKNQVSENEFKFLKFIMEYQESELEQQVPCDMIRVLDIFEFKHNNQDYIVTVMEQGDTDLYQYLKSNRTKLTEIQKIKICLDITNPIYFLHKEQKLHRDIKPENYIQVEGKFKLIDFGLIKQSNRVQTIGVGTPIFQAPEIVDNSQNYNQKVDVWALACVYYEIFNEEALFNYQDFQQIRDKIIEHKRNQNEVFQKINRMNCNQQFKQLMQNMLQPKIENRFDSFQVIKCLTEICNKMIQQPNPFTQQSQINRLQTPFPQNFQQINNNIISNINNSQNQVNYFEEQLLKQIKISEEKTEKNSKQLEIKLIKMLEEKEQKQLEIFKQIQQKQEKNEQNYQQQILTINQQNGQLTQKQKEEINSLENQFNQEKTQQQSQISNLVNQVNFLVQNQNEYLKKQECYKLIENQKQEYLQQYKALQSKAEQTSNQTFQQISNTYNKEQVNFIVQNQLSESINKFQQQFNIELNKKLEVLKDQIMQLNENQIPKNNIFSKNAELDQKFGQLDFKLQLFMNKYENNYKEQQKHIQNFQFQINSLQQQNRGLIEKSQANQINVENQMKQNFDQMNQIQQTDMENLKNSIQQEMKGQLLQEISQCNIQNEDLQRTIKAQFTQELVNVKDSLQLEIQNYTQQTQQQNDLLENELKIIKLNMKSQENNYNLQSVTIDQLKQQYEQQTNNIQLVSQELYKYQQKPLIKQELYEPQNQQQNEQLQKIEQNLLQHSQFQEQLRQQQEYILQQINTYIYPQLQQQYQQIQHIIIQMNEMKENCDYRLNQIKNDLQNNLNYSDSIIEKMQANSSNQLKEFNDFQKLQRKIFNTINQIMSDIPNIRNEQLDQLKDQILGLSETNQFQRMFQQKELIENNMKEEKISSNLNDQLLNNQVGSNNNYNKKQDQQSFTSFFGLNNFFQPTKQQQSNRDQIQIQDNQNILQSQQASYENVEQNYLNSDDNFIQNSKSDMQNSNGGNY